MNIVQTTNSRRALQALTLLFVSFAGTDASHGQSEAAGEAAWRPFTGRYTVSPIPQQLQDWPQMVTIKINGRRYLRSASPIPTEYKLHNQLVQFKGRLRAANSVERSFWDLDVVEISGQLTASQALPPSVKAGVIASPQRVADMTTLKACVGAWCSLHGVLESIDVPSVGMPYGRVRLADETLIELLVVVTSDVSGLWMALLGEDVTVIGRVLAVSQGLGRVSRADAICIGVVDRCGMSPGVAQGKRIRKTRLIGPK